MAALLVLAALGLALSRSARAAGTVRAHPATAGVTITTRPALAPAFDPSISTYAIRCEPSERVTVSVSDSGGTPVSVDRQPAELTSFTTSLRTAAGQRFTMRVGTGSTAATYSVRCLPQNFPGYSAQIFGQPQAAYYLVTPGLTTGTAPAASFVALFDSHGVPVWWYQESTGTPLDATLMSGDRLAWNVSTASPAILAQYYGDGNAALEKHSLTGATLGTLNAVGSQTDFHEGQQLSNGNFLVTTYPLRHNVDLSSVFGYGTGDVLDASFQEITPANTLVYAWDSAAEIAPVESARWWWQLNPFYPNDPETVWDAEHIDSVTPDGDGFLVSLRNTDAVYMIRASDGSIEWKLGGTPTAQSLTILNDFDASTDFGGQNDAWVWPDGTVSVYDNGSNRNRAPRVLRFAIDPQARTATLIQTLTEPAATRSDCCGSARMLPGGDWVVSWGDSGVVDELGSNGQPVLRLTFDTPYFTYRAVPVLPGQLQTSALVAAMDRMNARPPAGLNAPALSELRVSRVGQRMAVTFSLAWRGLVGFVIEHALPGRRQGGRCLAVTAADQGHRACTRFVAVGSPITLEAVRGRNRFSLAAALGGRVLGPGEYRLLATSMLARRTGARHTVTFRVLS